MATLFYYGPYVSVSEFGLPPGQEEYWTAGPWPWWSNVVTVTAQPFALTGADRTVTVTSISARAAPNGDRFINFTVRNIGQDSANYAFWIAGVAP